MANPEQCQQCVLIWTFVHQDDVLDPAVIVAADSGNHAGPQHSCGLRWHCWGHWKIDPHPHGNDHFEETCTPTVWHDVVRSSNLQIWSNNCFSPRGKYYLLGTRFRMTSDQMFGRHCAKSARLSRSSRQNPFSQKATQAPWPHHGHEQCLLSGPRLGVCTLRTLSTETLPHGVATCTFDGPFHPRSSKACSRCQSQGVDCERELPNRQSYQNIVGANAGRIEGLVHLEGCDLLPASWSVICVGYMSHIAHVEFPPVAPICWHKSGSIPCQLQMCWAFKKCFVEKRISLLCFDLGLLWQWMIISFMSWNRLGDFHRYYGLIAAISLAAISFWSGLCNDISYLKKIATFW